MKNRSNELPEQSPPGLAEDAAEVARTVAPVRAPAEEEAAGQGASLIDLATALGRSRRTLVAAPLACALLALGVTFLMPNVYTGTARLMPPQQGSSAASLLMGQLGGIGGIASSALGLKNPSDLYIGVLKSYAIEDAIIARFNLKELYGEKLLVDTRSRLAAASSFSTDKTGLITIEVDARDPKLAADLANAYVEELTRVTASLALTQAAQRRVVFERQLADTKKNLADSEARLRRAMGGGGLVSVEAQSMGTVDTLAKLRADASVKQVELEAMRAYAADGNSDIVRTQRELQALRREIARLEAGEGPQRTGDPARGPSAPAVPAGLANIELLRDVKYNQFLFEVLAKQYEAARIDEAINAPVIQALDIAAPPERRSSPRRGLITIAAFLAGAVLAMGSILVRHSLRGERLDAEQRRSLRDLRDAWFGRG